MEKRSIFHIAASIIFCISLTACAQLGFQTPGGTDPLTGGADASTSQLLNIPIPGGLQRYASHGYITIGANGAKEGLEIFRGNIDGQAAASYLFTTLKNNGWQLCMYLRKDSKAVYLYKKNEEYGLLSFYRQGILTILEIWAAPQLPEGAAINLSGSETPSLQGEEYGPITQPEQKGVQWGGNVEEREL